MHFYIFIPKIEFSTIFWSEKLSKTHLWFIGSPISINASILNHEHKILKICGWHMYVATTYWLSRNNFRSKKTKLGQFIGGVFQSLKVANKLAIGFGCFDLSIFELFETHIVSFKDWMSTYHSTIIGLPNRIKNQKYFTLGSHKQKLIKLCLFGWIYD